MVEWIDWCMGALKGSWEFKDDQYESDSWEEG